MTQPEYALRTFSAGVGVQSIAIGLLAAEGRLPKPDLAIFADTGWEPQAVYDNVERFAKLMQKAGIEFVTVSHGNLRDDVLDPDVPGVTIPAFIQAESGKKAILNRQCTSRYKLEPIRREIRRRLGAKSTRGLCRYCDSTGRRIVPQSRYEAVEREGVCSVCRGTGEVERVDSVRNGLTAECWVGFSTDEISRVGPSRVEYVVNTFPLLDLGMSRKDCERLLRERGWEPVKSACIGCPFHGNRAWRELRDTCDCGHDAIAHISVGSQTCRSCDCTAFRHSEWDDGVAFDRALREMPGAANRRGSEAFLHTSLLPLDQAPIDRVSHREWADRQSDLFDHIEDGDPDGCSPYGCRSGAPVVTESQETTLESEAPDAA